MTLKKTCFLRWLSFFMLLTHAVEALPQPQGDDESSPGYPPNPSQQLPPTQGQGQGETIPPKSQQLPSQEPSQAPLDTSLPTVPDDKQPSSAKPIFFCYYNALKASRLGVVGVASTYAVCSADAAFRNNAECGCEEGQVVCRPRREPGGVGARNKDIAQACRMRCECLMPGQASRLAPPGTLAANDPEYARALALAQKTHQGNDWGDDWGGSSFRGYGGHEGGVGPPAGYPPPLPPQGGRAPNGEVDRGGADRGSSSRGSTTGGGSPIPGGIPT